MHRFIFEAFCWHSAAAGAVATALHLGILDDAAAAMATPFGAVDSGKTFGERNRLLQTSEVLGFVFPCMVLWPCILGSGDRGPKNPLLTIILT